MTKIKVTSSLGAISYPSDLNGLTYEQAVEQLNLLEQNPAVEPERQLEDALVITYADGSWSIFEIEY